LQSGPTHSNRVEEELRAELEDDLNKLKSPIDPAGDDIQKIVETKIVKPAFQRLNDKKKTFLETPFDTRTNELLVQAEKFDADNPKHRLDNDRWKAAFDKLKLELAKLKFTEPQNKNWWVTYDEKIRMSAGLAANSGKVVETLAGNLMHPAKELDDIMKRLTEDIRQDESNEQKLKQGIQELEAKYMEVQNVLKGSSQLFSVVSLDLKTATLYYPIALALVFIWFLWRYLRWRGKADMLAEVYRKQGLSDTLCQLYFAKVTSATHSKSAGFRSVMLLLLCALPLAIGVWSVWKIVNTPDLGVGAPIFWYRWAGVLYLAAYVTLGWQLLCHPKIDKL
jgi:hypothetical protein